MLAGVGQSPNRKQSWQGTATDASSAVCGALVETAAWVKMVARA
jgi:hypothetical protein